MSRTSSSLALLGTLLLSLFTAVQPAAAQSATSGRLVFESTRNGNQQLYSMNPDGTGVTQLTFFIMPTLYPACSNTGKIAFATSTPQIPSKAIYVMNADGSNPVQVTTGQPDDSYPAWSPDGTRIAFTRYDNGLGVQNIWVMKANGSNQQQLTLVNSQNNYKPAWSPDGQKIAFDSNRSGADQIWVMNADGSHPVNLSNSGVLDTDPAWSPDGQKIVFTRGSFPDSQLMVMNADGTGQSVLVSSMGQNAEPAWSPDGLRIAFYSTRSTSSPQLYVMNADGSNQTMITNSAGESRDPCFQPQAPQTGGMLISEFRLTGSGGSADEVVELYNNTGAPLTVNTSDGSTGWALVASDGGVRFIIPAGTFIPARGHYLGVNSTSYSLASYAVGDRSYSTDIPADGGLALFNTADAGSFTMANRLDGVGFSGVVDPLYRSGTGLTPANGVADNAEYSFVRKLNSGVPQATNDNLADFILIAPDPAIITSAPAVLGAPSPENLHSPIQQNAQIKASLIDPCSGGLTCQNRIRDLSPDAGEPSHSTLGTLKLRRKFTNKTGAPITRLRFRVVDITTLNSPGGPQADLRVLNSSASTVILSTGQTAQIVGLTREEPPIQTANGGGLNTSLAAGVVSLNTPLAAGASINVEFNLGVMQGGSFRFLINVEALNGAGNTTTTLSPKSALRSKLAG
jgi:Tol biopolymer transport system component